MLPNCRFQTKVYYIITCNNVIIKVNNNIITNVLIVTWKQKVVKSGKTQHTFHNFLGSRYYDIEHF